jgi:hypothetical protein
MANLGRCQSVIMGTPVYPGHRIVFSAVRRGAFVGRNRAWLVDRKSGETVDGFRFVGGFEDRFRPKAPSRRDNP